MMYSPAPSNGIDHTAGFFIKIGLILFVMIAGMLATLFSNGTNLVPICVMLLIVVFVVLYIEKTILDSTPAIIRAPAYSGQRMYTTSPNRTRNVADDDDTFHR